MCVICSVFFEDPRQFFVVIYSVFFVLGGPKANCCCYLLRFFLFWEVPIKANVCCYFTSCFLFLEVPRPILAVIYSVFIIFGGPKANFCCYLQRFVVFGSPKANFCCYLQRCFWFLEVPTQFVCCYLQRVLNCFWRSHNQCWSLFTAFFCFRKFQSEFFGGREAWEA